MKEILLRQPDDWHAHMRDGNLMENIIGLFEIYGRVVCMGNLADSADTARKALTYKKVISAMGNFKPIIGIMLTKNSTVEEWQKIYDLMGNTAFLKYMPEGVTTNSELGIPWTELENYYPIFEFAQDRKIPVLIHAEIDRNPWFYNELAEIDREKAAVQFVAELASAFPELIINVEHVSTKEMIGLIKIYGNLSGSISPNHLIHSYRCVFDDHGNIINIHKYFKPVAKNQDDKEAVIAAALSGNQKFFFGSDSAPHLKIDKKVHKKAGAFNALTNLAFLCEFFEEHGALDKFEPFVSEHGARRYGLPLNTEIIRLKRQAWKVPAIYRGIVPDLAGRGMKWRIGE